MNETTNIDPHRIHTVNDCRIIELPRHRHANGSLTVSHSGNPEMDVPFNIKRVFYLYDVPADASRGGHSHFSAEEVIIAATGSFDVVIDDGHSTRRFSLNRPYKGLYIPTGLWRTLDNFSGGAMSLVLTSECYSEEDYVRDYQRFKTLTADKIKI